MSWKKCNNLISIFLIFIVGIYVYDVNYSASQAIIFNSGGVGPTYFPNVLAGITIFLCLVVLIKDNVKSKENSVFEILNLKLVLLTVMSTVVFLLSWQFFGYFYFSVFALVFTLLVFYRDSSFTNRMIIAFFTAISVSVFVYLLFGKLLSLSL